jgi:N-methylhydantoinase A
MADFRSDFIRTVYLRLSQVDSQQIEERFREIEGEAHDWLEAQKVDQASDLSEVRLARSADMRYRGQSFELTVPAPDDLSSADGMVSLLDGFHGYYEQIYGHSDRAAEAEIISLRVQVVGRTLKPNLGEETGQPGRNGAAPEPVGEREVRLADHAWEVPVYERAALEPGMRLSGPCIIEQYDSTILVTPGFELQVDSHSNVIGRRID